jgi:ABC-type Fe3+ transport system permease subunit
VLLLRPFGFDTLSVRVWQLTADSRYEMAGLPALAIVLVAMVPVVLLFRGGDAVPTDEEAVPGLPALEDQSHDVALAGVAR